MDRFLFRYFRWLIRGAGPGDDSTFAQRLLMSGVVAGGFGLLVGLVWLMLWLDGAPDAPWNKRAARAEARAAQEAEAAAEQAAFEARMLEARLLASLSAEPTPAPTPAATPARQTGEAYQLSRPAVLRESPEDAGLPVPAGAWVQVKKTHEAHEYVEARLEDGTSLGFGWLTFEAQETR